MIQKRSLFNIPFWQIKIINFEEKKNELTKLLESYPEERKGLQEFATNRQIGPSDLINGFFSIMNQELEAFSREIEKEYTITDLWSLSYNRGDFHPAHNHSSIGLSGILYLDLPKDSPVTEYIQPWNNYVGDTVQYYAEPVVEGDIVIVPSFILHFSNPNKSENIKRIISWDMKIL